VRKFVRGVLLRAAGAAGTVIGVLQRTAAGAAGALLVSYGMWLAWAPLGFACAGGFLLLLDRRAP
jgi:hypothetical protein